MEVIAAVTGGSEAATTSTNPFESQQGGRGGRFGGPGGF